MYTTNELEEGSLHDFKRLSSEPNYWLMKAKSLHASAAAVWHCTQVRDSEEVAREVGGDPNFGCGAWQVYRMLCGMALELAFKTILVVRQEKVDATHDLVRLAEKADVTYSDKQKKLLALLTECVVWEGKYPVPRNHQDIDRFVFWHYETLYTKKRMGENSWIMQPIKPDPLDWDQYNELWGSAMAAYEWFKS